MNGADGTIPCIGCEFGQEVWYERWPGFGAVPGEAASQRYAPQSPAIDAMTIAVLAIALYILWK